VNGGWRGLPAHSGNHRGPRVHFHMEMRGRADRGRERGREREREMEREVW